MVDGFSKGAVSRDGEEGDLAEGEGVRRSLDSVESVKVADTSTMLGSVYVRKNACCERRKRDDIRQSS